VKVASPTPVGERPRAALTKRTRRPRGQAAALVLMVLGMPVLLVSIAVSTTIGAADVTALETVEVIGAKLGLWDTDLSVIRQGVVWDLRLPRVLVAVTSGAGLGVCGAVLQSVLRNPLADPYLLGISTGASTGAVTVVVLGVGSGVAGLTIGAFAGSLIAFTLVMVLAAVAGGGTARVILAGVAATQLFSAITSYIVITSADAEQTRGVLFWLLGSLARARWDDVVITGVVCAAALVVCLSRSADLDAFAFGTGAAISLGVNVRMLRGVLLTTTALLTAVLVASTGAIGFVGLVLPHAARLLVGPSNRLVLPTTALLGAILLIWVDALGRTIAAPVEVPVGVITALVGVPAFVVLLARRGARG
jgi:iron complex transport system permease protein